MEESVFCHALLVRFDDLVNEYATGLELGLVGILGLHVAYRALALQLPRQDEG
jgi:hypothetical protein